MLTWAGHYWFLCLIAGLIGLATGWWMWGRASRRSFRRRSAVTLSGAGGFDAPPPDAAPGPPVVATPLAEGAVADEPLADAPPVLLDQAAAPAQRVPDDRPDIPSAVGDPDDLRMIRGVGPSLSALLHGLGVHRFDQIAAWGEAEVAEVDRCLANFRGRITRDNWVDQAGYLARGDLAGFAARYGDLGGDRT